MILPRLGEEDQDLMWEAGYERNKKRGKYYIFAYPTYYPAGGMGDLVEIVKDTREKAIDLAKEYSIEYNGTNDYVIIWDVMEDKEIKRL